MSCTRMTNRLCTLIALDVKNVFNSATWIGIVGVMRRLGIAPYLIHIIKSYLSHRKVITEAAERTDSFNITCGVP